jgi:tRNA G18 (ribose-2'-O)-methylase SpoU
MQGVKTTLNVAVAFGIAVYFLRYALPRLGHKEREGC